MWFQFFLENSHFAINMFSALVTFAVFWLYFDAFSERKTLKEGLRMAGFLLLSISFVVHASTIEIPLFQNPIISFELSFLILTTTRILGYILITLSLILDPLQPKPMMSKKAKVSMEVAIPLVLLPGIVWASFIHPILSGVVALLYLRRATIGLENHLKGVALAFFVITISELLSLGSLLRDSGNVDLYNIVASFGPLWIAEHVILLVGVGILGKWVFGYLLKRLQSQLLMIFTSAVLVIFLLTTVTFSYLLLKNMETENLKQLEVDVKVLSLSLDSKKAESLSDSQILAQNTQVITATKDKSHKDLVDLTQNFLLGKKQSFLVVVGDNGQVIARGEDREKYGDNLSEDPLIKRALLGETLSSVMTKEGVLSPRVSVRSAVSVKEGDKIVGAVITGLDIDNTFVDGIKSATGLEASIYAGNKLSATTLLVSDGKSRPLGVNEENTEVKNRVLQKGDSFTGSLEFLSVPYLGAYLPLKDVDNVPIGMLSVAKPQLGVLQAAGRSIELTFLVAALLMVLSVIPAYFISKYLAYQLG